MNKPSIYYLFLLFFSCQVFAVSSFDAFDKKKELLMTCEHPFFEGVRVGKKGNGIFYHFDTHLYEIIESDTLGKRYIIEVLGLKNMIDFKERRIYWDLNDPTIFDKCW